MGTLKPTSASVFCANRELLKPVTVAEKGDALASGLVDWLPKRLLSLGLSCKGKLEEIGLPKSLGLSVDPPAKGLIEEKRSVVLLFTSEALWLAFVGISIVAALTALSVSTFGAPKAAKNPNEAGCF